MLKIDLSKDYNLYDIREADGFNLSNKNFWHYTNIKSLNKIIETHTFRLSKISDTNDEEEKKRLHDKKDYTYIVCFCNTQAERISMWIIYSGLDQGVALGVRPTVMKKILSNARIYGVSNDKRHELELEKDVTIKYNWICYKPNEKNNKLKYRNKYENDISINKGCTFVKDYPWEYEQEFRIVAELKGKLRDKPFEYVLIEFDESLVSELKVRFSSTIDNNSKDEKALLNNGIKKENVDKSKLKHNINLFEKNKKYYSDYYLNYLKELVKSKNKEDKDYIKKIKEIIK